MSPWLGHELFGELKECPIYLELIDDDSTLDWIIMLIIGVVIILIIGICSAVQNFQKKKRKKRFEKIRKSIKRRERIKRLKDHPHQLGNEIYFLKEAHQRADNLKLYKPMKNKRIT